MSAISIKTPPIFSALVLTILASSAALTPSSSADEPDGWDKLRDFITINGGVDSGGGDGFVEEFVGYSRLAVRIAKTRWDIPGIPITALEAQLLSAKVEVVFQILKDGGNVERDALNFPKENRILVSRMRWKELDANQKLILALHEHLGLLRIPDPGYQTSERLLNRDRLPIPKPATEPPESGSQDCPDRAARAPIRELVVQVREINEQNAARIDALATATSSMIADLRRLGSERIRLTPDPLPSFEEFVRTLKTYGLITGLEALEQDLISKFPKQCKNGVAQAIRLFLPMQRQQADDARVQLEIWKESLNTVVRFLREQDLKPPQRSYNRASLVFVLETMLNHLEKASRAYGRLNSDLSNLSFAFLAAD